MHVAEEELPVWPCTNYVWPAGHTGRQSSHLCVQGTSGPATHCSCISSLVTASLTGCRSPVPPPAFHEGVRIISAFPWVKQCTHLKSSYHFLLPLPVETRSLPLSGISFVRPFLPAAAADMVQGILLSECFLLGHA